MAPRLVAVVVGLVGTRIGCYSRLSLGLGIPHLKDSSQVGAARYVVVAVARAAERAAAWTVASLVAAHAAAVARRSVAQSVHVEPDSAESVCSVASAAKAHSHYLKASRASALGSVPRFRSAARLEARY